MPKPSSRVRLVAKFVGALAALAMFVSSLSSLLALDSELQGAVSAERRPVSVRVSFDVEPREQSGECRWYQERTQDRLPS